MAKVYNTYKNRLGQNIPKTAIIQNDVELIDWLKDTFPWQFNNSKSNIIETDDYLVVGISASRQGNVYFNFYTAKYDFIERFANECVKDFTNCDNFKKYIMWVTKLPKRIING